MWTMPPEWRPHSATWMCFPTGAYDTAGVSDDNVFDAWSNVANTISEHEPVHMLCHPQRMAIAQKKLASDVMIHAFEIDDAWMRDSGPTFVTGEHGLGGVDWMFNGWGDHTAFGWSHDAKVASHIIELTGAERIGSDLVNEGGGIHVNGLGDVLLTRTVQLDPGRNPVANEETVEEEVHRKLGTKRAVWFDRGLWRDYQDHGTRGHIDMIATFVPDGSVLLHRQFNKNHPDHVLWQDHCETLESAGFTVRALPAPRLAKDNIGWVDYSYVNHYVGNGFVLLPAFNDRNDNYAIEILKDLYPDRYVTNLDARTLFAMGGGIHCVTQQEPAAPTR